MSAYLLVGLGSGAGGMLRYWLARLVTAQADGVVPWGTVFVNVSGSLAIGVLAALAIADGRLFGAEGARQLLMVGLLGGYTTFSAFSLDALALFHGGHTGAAASYVLITLLGCLTAVWAGHGLAAAVVHAL